MNVGKACVSEEDVSTLEGASPVLAQQASTCLQMAEVASVSLCNFDLTTKRAILSLAEQLGLLINFKLKKILNL